MMILTTPFHDFFMQIILKVHLDDNEERCLEFPVTPESTCEDVLACMREPGDGSAIITQLSNGQGKLLETFRSSSITCKFYKIAMLLSMKNTWQLSCHTKVNRLKLVFDLSSLSTQH